MADGYFPTLVSKDKDPNSASDPIFVQLSNGTMALSVTGTSLDVNLTNSSVPVTGTFWQATQPVSGTVAVSGVSGTVAVTQSTSPWAVDGSGYTQPVSGTFWQATQPVSGTVAATQSGTWVLSANSGVDIGDVTINNAAGASAVNIQDGGNSITVDGSVSISGSVTVTASALDIRTITKATDSIQVSANASVNGPANPIYVALGSGPISGEVHSYDAASTTTTTDHDYTVVTAMLVKGIECASSGGAKFDLLTGPLSSLVAKWTGLIPKQGGTISVKFDPPIEVPVTSTGTVRITRTNRESQAQSLYTTIIGIDA
jgi:hypothetical protein